MLAGAPWLVRARLHHQRLTRLREVEVEWTVQQVREHVGLPNSGGPGHMGYDDGQTMFGGTKGCTYRCVLHVEDGRVVRITWQDRDPNRIYYDD